MVHLAQRLAELKLYIEKDMPAVFVATPTYVRHVQELIGYLEAMREMWYRDGDVSTEGEDQKRP